MAISRLDYNAIADSLLQSRPTDYGLERLRLSSHFQWERDVKAVGEALTNNPRFEIKHFFKLCGYNKD